MATPARTIDIEGNLREYLAGRQPEARYASFDYCFNFFQAQHEAGFADLGNSKGRELACLQLGFYLASWGMFRGRSQLLQRSLRIYESVVEAIASAEDELWSIDVDSYDATSIDAVLDAGWQIRRSFRDGARDTLVTKVMLGVFGCVPAFDRNFRRGFGAYSLGRSALARIHDFYEQNVEVIERHRVATLDVATGEDATHRYPRAKVIDMIFFIEGQR